MERNTNQPRPGADQAAGEYLVGEEIVPNNGAEERADVAAAVDPDVDQSHAPVAGDNAERTGDADAMTSGNSADPAPDDSAMRPTGRP